MLRFATPEGVSTYVPGPTLQWKPVPHALRYEVSLDGGPFVTGAVTTSGGFLQHILKDPDGSPIKLGPRHVVLVRAVVPGSEARSGISSILFLDATTAGTDKDFAVSQSDFLPLGQYAVRVFAQDTLGQDGADGLLAFGVSQLRISIIPSERTVQLPTAPGNFTVQMDPGGATVDGADISINVTSPLGIGGLVSSGAGVTITLVGQTGTTLDFKASFPSRSGKFDLVVFSVTASSSGTGTIDFKNTVERPTQALRGLEAIPVVPFSATVTVQPAPAVGAPSPANTAPTAEAGDAQTVNEGTVVTLDGTGSSDPQVTAGTQILSFLWTQVPTGAPLVTITGDDTATSSFLAADGPATFTFQLLVNDGQASNNLGLDTVFVSVNNVDPVLVSVTASPSELPSTGGASVITVVATDVAGAADPLTYSFDCSGDNTFEIKTGDRFATCTFTGANTGDNVVNVHVDDGDGGIASSSVTVRVSVVVENQRPTARAGGESTDADGRIINYKWDFGDETSDEGPNPVQTHVYADNGTFTVRLTVTDNEGATGDATLQVTVEDVEPVVILGTVAPANEGDEVRITGTFADVGVEDTHSASIAWGDGEIDAVDPFVSPFSRTHKYLDDSKGGTFTITVTVTDKKDAASQGSANTPVLIRNVAPTVNAGPD